MAACGSTQQDSKPKDLLSDEVFIAVLTDVQLLEATYKQKILREEDPNAVMPGYYKQVFDKHGVSQDDFEDTFSWWMKRPEEMLEVYNEVIDQLTKLEKEHLEEDQ
jgi:hypothetical protein